jgi:uncharacterized membrane protein
MLKTVLLWILALFMLSAGVGHFVNAAEFIRIVPSFLPYPEALVYISGVCEIAIGIGLLIPKLRPYAAWGLIALLIAVFPANVNMAIHKIPFGPGPTPEWLLWARLPLQGVLLAWAWWYTRPSTSR